MESDLCNPPPSYEAATSISTTHQFLPNPSAPPGIAAGHEKATSSNIGWNTTLLITPDETLPQSTSKDCCPDAITRHITLHSKIYAKVSIALLSFIFLIMLVFMIYSSNRKQPINSYSRSRYRP